MTGLEAVPKLGELLGRLLKLSKEREASALVQQIQEYQLVLYKELVEAHAQIRALKDELAATKNGLAQTQQAKPLEHRRALFYQAGDAKPFCPHCWENEKRQIHLYGPVATIHADLERWEYHTCNRDYDARPGEDFRPHLSRSIGRNRT